jgi:hypothetical protein
MSGPALRDPAQIKMIIATASWSEAQKIYDIWQCIAYAYMTVKFFCGGYRHAL